MDAAPAKDVPPRMFDSLGLVWSSRDTPKLEVLKKLFIGRTPVERKYLLTGAAVGHALSYAAYGAFPSRREVRRLVRFERQYAEQGYQPISIDAFKKLGGWGEDISDIFRQGAIHVNKDCVVSREPRYYALEFQKEYFPTLLDRVKSYLSHHRNNSAPE